ncbi:hypothetical protein NP233_g8045 [Leucocoprinus birnbaumii]|uniref:Thioredoxin domain-containing protein n=1 Tax=Leucocoprinus birnbaumii TaxID=56174 RepID=A0AAD5VN74_9AGAR|nr:hypothetical protein NP233_g8045 [Leucocoprinus birnbaumii]
MPLSIRTALRPLRNVVHSASKGTTTRSLVHPRSFHTSRPNAAVFSRADKETLDKVLKESSGRVVLVDFYADWCGPCYLLAPILEKYSGENNKSANGVPVDLVKIDIQTDEGRALAMAHNVHAIPTVHIYKDGQVVKQFKGALPEAKFKEILDNL